jgi:hypothetical protein
MRELMASSKMASCTKILVDFTSAWVPELAIVPI